MVDRRLMVALEVILVRAERTRMLNSERYRQKDEFGLVKKRFLSREGVAPAGPFTMIPSRQELRPPEVQGLVRAGRHLGSLPPELVGALTRLIRRLRPIRPIIMRGAHRGSAGSRRRSVGLPALPARASAYFSGSRGSRGAEGGRELPGSRVVACSKLLGWP